MASVNKFVLVRVGVSLQDKASCGPIEKGGSYINRIVFILQYLTGSGESIGVEAKHMDEPIEYLPLFEKALCRENVTV